MSDFDIDVSGLAAIRGDIDDLSDDIERPGTWYVGTGVEYSIYLEFGTSKMDPKPFFRPAVAEAKRDSDSFIQRHEQVNPETIDDVDTYIKVLALAIENRVKEIITEKGLVDTGTLRASVLAVPTDPSGLPSADAFPDEDVSPDAGRSLVEDIEINL
jgi:hypothetical protein